MLFSPVHPAGRKNLLLLGTAVLRHVAVAATELLCQLQSSVTGTARVPVTVSQLITFLQQEYVLLLRHMAGLTITTLALFFDVPKGFGAFCK